MSEVIFIPFVDPEAKEIRASNPYKLVLNENSFDLFARHDIVSEDEDSGIIRDFQIDRIETYFKSEIIGVGIGKSIKHDVYIFKIQYPGGFTIDFFLNTKQEANDYYQQFKSWLGCK